MHAIFGVMNHFNPRSHARSDSCRIKFLVIHCVFQSTLPRKERPGGTYDPAVVKNFNPRSHARSDSHLRSNDLFPIISIHAPTQGATPRLNDSSLICGISIHAPTQGATIFILPDIHIRQFQSTLPRKERHKVSAQSAETSAISIHAPTQGATIWV